MNAIFIILAILLLVGLFNLAKSIYLWNSIEHWDARGQFSKYSKNTHCKDSH